MNLADSMWKIFNKMTMNRNMNIYCFVGGRKHQKFIQQCKSNTEEVNDKSPGPLHFGIASEKEVLQLSTGEREKISFPHESLKMVSLFLSSDQEKSKIGTGVSHQPGANFSQNKLLSNFPENSDDESAHSTFRKRYVSSKF